MKDRSLFFEMMHFLAVRKAWWMLPIVLMLLLLAIIIVFSQSTAISPFIYALW